MTDQETLNKLFDAALKAPEPEAKPKPESPAINTPGADKAAASTPVNTAPAEAKKPEPQAQAKVEPQTEPKPEPKPEPQARQKAEPVADESAMEDEPKPGFFKRIFGKI